MTSPRVLAIAVSLLSLAACSAGTPPSTPAASAAVATTSKPAAASATVYSYSELDLCAVTDLKPLADLKLTLQDKRRALPSGRKKGEGEACLHEMKTSSGQIARLTVEAILAKSADEATSIYRAATQDSMKSDGVVAGLGEQAEGRWLDTESGYKHSEYLVHARNGNLHISVWLAVGGSSFTPKETLAPKVKAVAEATYATVTSTWK